MRAQIVVVLALWLTAAGCGGGHPTPAGTAAPRPAKTAAATASPVAGSPPRRVALGQYGFLDGRVGWGDAHPDRLDMGGDPALVITRIRWHGWGSPHARGVGRGPAFNYLGGSAYRRPVRVELRADELGRCAASGPRAYRNLRLRMPTRPGAPMGQWFILGGGEHGLCRR
jgi:hypothetical protein